MINGSAKLRALRALMPHVLRALRVLVPHVPRALRALVPYMPRALCASWLTCLVPHASSAFCLTCFVPQVLSCLTGLAYSRAVRASNSTGSCAPRPSLPSGVSSLTNSCTSHVL